VKRGPQAITSGTSIIAARRRAEMLRLRLEGQTLEEIGEAMGIKPESVHGVITRALTSMVKAPAEELLTLELARCDELLEQALETVHAFHPLINSGCVVRAIIEDENGNPSRDTQTGDIITRTLEDKAPKLAAINTALRVMERRAKLLGLDKPTKIAATDPTGKAASSPVVIYIPHNGRESFNGSMQEAKCETSGTFS
jgi:hypothetical protein